MIRSKFESKLNPRYKTLSYNLSYLLQVNLKFKHLYDRFTKKNTPVRIGMHAISTVTLIINIFFFH